MDDEDDFAMIAEDLFTDLDAEDKGKISKNEIRNALVHMGVEMGVPPFSGSLFKWLLVIIFSGKLICDFLVDFGSSEYSSDISVLDWNHCL